MATNAVGRAAAAQETSVSRDEVRKVSDLCRAFVNDVREISRGCLMFGDPSDSEGADFVFTLEVPRDRYQSVVQRTSGLEAEYYFQHGVNFLIDVKML